MTPDIDALSSGLFFPRAHPVPDSLPRGVHLLKINVAGDATIGGFAALKEKKFPTVLLFHGNGEVAMEYLPLVSAFLACGVNLAVVDFRGYGFSTGTPSFAALQKDCFPCHHALRTLLGEHGFARTIIAMGRSLGSTCAAELASKGPQDLAGVIFESGFGSAWNVLRRLVPVEQLGLTREDVRPYSNDVRLSTARVPVLIIHGSRDEIIPVEEARVLHDALPRATWREIRVIDGAGHNDIMMFEEEYFSAIASFVKHIGPR